METEFKKKNSLESRKSESERIRRKYPDRIPIIVSKIGNDVPDIDKSKFLVPFDLTIGQFVYVIRKRIKLPPEKAMFVFCKDSLAQTSALCGSVYEQFKDKDGFLYVSYSGENTFG